MKNESGKANKEKQDGMHGKRYVWQKKHSENQKEKIRLCVAISLGAGALLFSVWTFSGKERDYTNENGYMAFEKAEGEGTSVGVLVSEKKAGQKSKKDTGNKAEKTAESATEDEVETESETETDTEPGMDSELETDDELRKTENKKEPQSETQPEKEPQTNTEKEKDSVLESEIEKKFKREEESEGERKDIRKESGEDYESEQEETETISEEITEEEPDTEEEWESESWEEIESEGMEESKENYESEEESEEGSERDETETISKESTEEEPATEEEWESEGMEESEENYESEEENERDETETISEESTEEEPATEEGREQESEEKRKEKPESEKESERDPGREQEKETEVSRETEEEAEKETGTSHAAPEPLPVYRGKQYEIRGDENAWYRDETGRLWVRKGSNIYVDPIKQQGYTQGGSVTDAQQDGRLTFQLKKTDAKGNVIAISTLQQEAYFVDGEVPEARIEPSGNLENGMVYAAQSSTVAVTVPPDGKSGLKRVAYRIEKGEKGSGDSGSEENGKWSDWVDCGENQLVNITGEGTYRVHVRTEDRVGNLAFSSSAPICVDCTPPQIEIKGVQGETANSGRVPIQVQCRDSFYRPGSLCVKIIGANNGKVPKIKASGEKKEFASTEFFDFPHEQVYDDAYRLEVKAEDLAGNITQKILDFSINRFGSVYDLSGETKKALQPYYLTEATDIVFLEMNIDYVGESEIYCRENGELKKLNRGEDYTVELQGSSDSWKQYRYTIPAAYFEKEGVYEMLLSSKDRAENESDTGLQGKQVTFALDWTEPECLVTGVEPLGIYRGEYQVACVQPKDNLGVQMAKIYHDSELVQTVERENTPVKLKLDEQQEWQTLQVYVRDLAGNEYWSPEIPVFVSGKTEEVLPYEKTRKSAQEKEEELILKRAGYGTGEDRKTADFARRTKEGEEEMETGKESGKNAAADKEKRQSGEGSLLGKMERIRRGRLLLAFGTILFLVTFLVCILPVGRRKK